MILLEELMVVQTRLWTAEGMEKYRMSIGGSRRHSYWETTQVSILDSLYMHLGRQSLLYCPSDTDT